MAKMLKNSEFMYLEENYREQSLVDIFLCLILYFAAFSIILVFLIKNTDFTSEKLVIKKGCLAPTFGGPANV